MLKPFIYQILFSFLLSVGYVRFLEREAVQRASTSISGLTLPPRGVFRHCNSIHLGPTFAGER